MNGTKMARKHYAKYIRYNWHDCPGWIPGFLLLKCKIPLSPAPRLMHQYRAGCPLNPGHFPGAQTRRHPHKAQKGIHFVRIVPKQWAAYNGTINTKKKVKYINKHNKNTL